MNFLPHDEAFTMLPGKTTCTKKTNTKKGSSSSPLPQRNNTRLSSDMMSAADAPSLRKDELAAVWVPCGLMNAGFSDPSFSRVESPLIPFSSMLPSTGII